MAQKRVKIGRITRLRKDGEDITFINWKGEEMTNRYAPVATLFASKDNSGRPPLVTLAFEEGFKADPSEEFYNLYVEKGVELDFDHDALSSKGSGGRGKKAGKKPARRPEPEGDEGEEGEEDPFQS